MPSAFLFRPLATALDDKVALQDCLETGRTAKVETSTVTCADILLLFVVVKAVKKQGIFRSSTVLNSI